ncbi:MAG TPA: hypothetical protein VJ890_23905 [Vineibacter sp.]|nr:hypothetical protein [Vineibacter sp.]
MDAIFRSLADPTVRGLYLALCLAVLILPMMALAWWYHSAIGKTAGGRDLMKAQADIGVPGRHNLVGSVHALWRAIALGRGVSAGRYGEPARRLQSGVYWATGVWLVANGVLFGILILADSVNRAAN